MLRNLFQLVGAGAGAWVMFNLVQQVSVAGVQFSGPGTHPMGGLLVPPALLLGAFVGSILASLLCPTRY